MELPDHSTLQFLITHGYWIAIPVMIVEGPIATMVMSFFASFGYFNPIVVFICSFLADMVSDTAFYMIGRFGGEKFVGHFGKYFKLSPKTFEIVRNFYEHHGGKSIFLAKILVGVVPPVFIVAGYSRMKLKKFYTFAALGGLIWSSVLVSLGYFFGSQFEGEFVNIGKFLTSAGLVMVALLALFIVYRFYLHTIIERKLKLVFANGKENNNGNHAHIEEQSGPDTPR